MGKLMSALKAGVARMGARLKSIPGVGGLINGWNGFYGGMMDGYEWVMEQADFAWDYTVDAAVHVGQDVRDFSKGFGEGMSKGFEFNKKVLFNNPVSKVLKNGFQVLTGDHRPRIVQDGDKSAKQSADKELKAAKEANPAELAAVKAAHMKNDPELIERYVKAESVTDRNEIKKQMSPKAQAWVNELKGTDLWSMKGKSAVEISAHLAGDKILTGVEKCADYYVATKAEPAFEAPKPEPSKDKTVTERRAERTAAKLAKRPGAANVTGTVPGQAPEQKPTAQQETMAFFGPKVAKEEEVSEYSQSQLPAYRPPVPRKAG